MKVCVFDAYGTLFDVAAAARALGLRDDAGRFGAVWQQVAADWRDKQLGYTWLLSAAGRGGDFWAVTEDALDWALAAQGLDGEAALRADLLALYRDLDAYPEAAEVLTALKAQGVATAILSNGTAEMVGAAAASAGIAPLLDRILSAESVGTFKPDPRVYALVTAHFEVAAEDVLFVSSNGWDIGFAGTHGFQTLWVNRLGAPQDRLPAMPDREARDLRGVLQGGLAE